MALKVGVIGVGEIGKPIAKRILANGYDVTVRGHMNMKPVEELKTMGAKVATSSKELAAQCDIVITVVLNTAQTDEVIWGKDGISEGIRKGSTVVIMSTIDPHFVQKTAARFKDRGVTVLDAPVSASRGVGIEAGTMAIMAGGDKSAFDRCKPIFDLWNNVFYMGDSGMGEVSKLVNNMLCFLNTLALVEAKGIADKAGLDFDKFLELVKVSSGHSWSAQRWEILCTNWHEKEKQGEVPWGLMYKDMRLALELAENLKAKVPMLGAGYQLPLSMR